MRVLHVAQPSDGGVGRVVSSIANVQASRGYDVSVASKAGSSLHEALSRQVDFRAWSACRRPRKRLIAESRSLRRIVRDVAPDVIHLHSSKAGLVGRLVVRGRIATVFQPHAWSWVAVDGRQASAALGWERHALRWTTKVVCVSQDEARMGKYAGLDTSRLTVIPNGVDASVFYPRDRIGARRDKGIVDGPTVVMVGRLSAEKGPDLLLDAWPQVLSEVPNARLMFVGDGPQRGELESEAQGLNGVEFCGVRKDPELWYAAADVVVLPSRREAMALAPLEAMASRRSVVGFDVEGFQECLGLSSGRVAVIEKEDVTGLANALVARLIDERLRNAEERDNFVRAHDRYTLSAVCAKMEDVYVEAIAKVKDTGGSYAISRTGSGSSDVASGT